MNFDKILNVFFIIKVFVGIFEEKGLILSNKMHFWEKGTSSETGDSFVLNDFITDFTFWITELDSSYNRSK